MYLNEKIFYRNMKKINTVIILLILCCPALSFAQDVNALVQKVKAKIEKVNDFGELARGEETDLT